MKYLLRALFGVATTMTITGSNAAQSAHTQDAEPPSEAAWDETVRDGSFKAYAEFSIKHSDDPRSEIAKSKLEEGLSEGKWIEVGGNEDLGSSHGEVKNPSSLIYV
ncbi:MAG: hypothetical protein AAGF25_05865 [Pseudomonadota bacterium]